MASQEAKQVFASLGFTEDGTICCDEVKEKAAELWDAIHKVTTLSQERELQRLAASAKTHLEITVMLAVKAISRE